METDAVVGTLTHRLVAQILQAQHSGLLPVGADVPAALIERGAALVAATAGLGSHRSRVRLRVVTSAGQYLHRFRPPASVEFLGTEMGVRDGIVDIAWRHPDLGVFFDELKTTRRATGPLPSDTAEQLRRYCLSGTAHHGELFAGVRYIPLLNPAGSLLVKPSGDGVSMTPLSSTPLSVCAPMEGAA